MLTSVVPEGEPKLKGGCLSVPYEVQSMRSTMSVSRFKCNPWDMRSWVCMRYIAHGAPVRRNTQIPLAKVRSGGVRERLPAILRVPRCRTGWLECHLQDFVVPSIPHLDCWVRMAFRPSPLIAWVSMSLQHERTVPKVFFRMQLLARTSLMSPFFSFILWKVCSSFFPPVFQKRELTSPGFCHVQGFAQRLGLMCSVSACICGEGMGDQS